MVLLATLVVPPALAEDPTIAREGFDEAKVEDASSLDTRPHRLPDVATGAENEDTKPFDATTAMTTPTTRRTLGTTSRTGPGREPEPFCGWSPR